MTGEEYISMKIPILMDEGYPQKQAIAIAYSMAREHGYEVPETGNPSRKNSSKAEQARKELAAEAKKEAAKRKLLTPAKKKALFKKVVTEVAKYHLAGAENAPIGFWERMQKANGDARRAGLSYESVSDAREEGRKLAEKKETKMPHNPDNPSPRKTKKRRPPTKRDLADRLTRATIFMCLEGWMDAPKKVKESYRRAFDAANKRLNTNELNKAIDLGKHYSKKR